MDFVIRCALDATWLMSSTRSCFATPEEGRTVPDATWLMSSPRSCLATPEKGRPVEN